MAHPGVNEAAGLLQNLMAVGAAEAQDWTCCFTTENHQLILGVRPDSDADQQLRIASGLAGGAAIRVVKQSFVRHANKQAHNRPIIGGIEIRQPDDGGSARGTLGVVVQKTNDNVIGVITAGHVVVQNGATVYQPRRSNPNNWEIGRVTHISDWAGHTVSDSAFVQLIDVESLQWLVWKSANSQYTVETTNAVVVGADVQMQGASTQATERTGKICSSNATVRFTDGGQLADQYLATYLSNDGDSGAPVYTKTNNGGINLIGINVGGTDDGSITQGAPNPGAYPHNANGQYAIVSKWSNVLADLGFAVNPPVQ